MLSSPKRGLFVPELAAVEPAAPEFAVVDGNLKAGALAVASEDEEAAAWLVCAPNSGLDGGLPAGVVEKAKGDERAGCGVVALLPVLKPAKVLEDAGGADVDGDAAPKRGFCC